MLAALPIPNSIVLDSRAQVESNRWLDFFDPQSALEQVINHIETLPGSRAERHTMRAYLSSLADYSRFLGARVIHFTEENYTFQWHSMAMPTKANTADYIAHCKRNGLASTTIVRYMAAVRLFLRALHEQDVQLQSPADFFFIHQARRFFFDQQLHCFSDLQLARLLAVGAQARKHGLDLLGHFFHAGRRHDLHLRARLGEVELEVVGAGGRPEPQPLDSAQRPRRRVPAEIERERPAEGQDLGVVALALAQHPSGGWNYIADFAVFLNRIT